MTIPKKFASGTGIRFEQPRAGLAKRHADRWVSMMARNSPWRLRRIGRDDLDRLKQRQARLDARTITSTHPAARERRPFSRRFLRELKTHRGRPKPAANARRPRPAVRPPNSFAIAKHMTARMPETTPMNFWLDQSRPAWVRRLLSGNLLSFWCAPQAPQRSFDLLARERWFLSTDGAAAGSGLAIEARRCSPSSPRTTGIDKNPCQPPMAVAREKG